MSDDLISEEMLYQNIDKIKASSAEIVVHGTKEKPYYEIEYFDLSDNEMHIGFSSYKLDVVFGYLEKYFDIVDKKSEHGKCESPITVDLISMRDIDCWKPIELPEDVNDRILSEIEKWFVEDE